MRFVKGLLKVIAAGLVAVAILCALLYVYNITPTHIKNPKGNTDYVWPANSIWVKATEGIAFGKYDGNGYNNTTVVDNPDVIILGSSHMEATNVMQDENASYLLSKKLSGRYSVYNMGISGHHFFKVCQYLPANMELYEEAPLVTVVETSTVDVPQSRVDQVVSSSVEFTPSHNTGIVGTLQKVPFFRTVYHQMEGGLLQLFMPGADVNTKNADDDIIAVDENKSGDADVDEAAYEELFSYLKEIEDKYGTQIIIFYHPTEKLTEDGTVYFSRDRELTEFRLCSEEYGISFIDMTDHFEKMYYEEHLVAHGFCTGKLAEGHLNKYGHAAVADELYNEIIRLKEAGDLCR